jgi:VanZ family protein
MIALSMGAATEIMQRLVFINRQGSVWDFIVDAAGAFLGAWICKRWRNNFLKM